MMQKQDGFKSNLKDKLIWFIGGFGIGLTLLSLGHAALPKKAAPQTAPLPTNNVQPTGSLLSEMRVNKVAAPEPEQDYSRLSTLESRYAESAEQQQRLKAATARSAGVRPTRGRQ